MNNYKTLIIWDWDDTIFSTTFSINNKIDINNPLYKDKYIEFFVDLDEIAYKLFKKIIKYRNTKIIIVTNAQTKWVSMCCEILPKTKKIIDILHKDTQNKEERRLIIKWLKKTGFNSLAKALQIVWKK